MSHKQANQVSVQGSAEVRATAAFLERADLFDAAWYLKCHPEVVASDPFEHYLAHGLPVGEAPNALLARIADRNQVPGVDVSSWGLGENFLEAEMEFLHDSGMFDADYYVRNNPDVAGSRLAPLLHFCKFGWRELRKPCAGFDVWWYWANYLDPGNETINPLLHYVLLGRHAGYRGNPASFVPRQAAAREPGLRARRICLFAGYDQDGIVDDYVIAYLRELSRFADIYYLADCDLADEELAKLSPYTKGAWAKRHGAYDFGSWAALANDYVGWDEIGRYDELVLSNDSCYLLTPLDGVFEKMDRKVCDWWGMQVTKGMALTRESPANAFRSPIPVEHVRNALLETYEEDAIYDFHAGSYFLVFRKSVLNDPGFRRLLGSVGAQASKRLIIQKYEIGITHYLVGNQYGFDTFIDHLHPFHPIYTATHFELIRQGFPFLKRYFLSQNHYDTPGLSAWKERILEMIPAADVEMFERNLLRVSDHDKLVRSFRIVEDASGKVVVPEMLSNQEFIKADGETPKFDHWWAFPACAFDDTFAGNERAVFEEVRDDPSIKKIVLSRRKQIRVDGENVVVVPLNSPEGQYYLLRSKQIFVKHAPSINAKFPLSSKLHNFINLWHGIPLKRFGPASLDVVGQRLESIKRENAACRAVISSSKVDALAMASAFYPLRYQDVWVTGLPRNDFILREEAELPADLREQCTRVREQLEGRRLVLFAPTFKNSQEDGYYRFGEDEIAFLRDWLTRNNAVLGVREHMADKARTYSRMLSSLGILDLSSARYPDIEMLYRESDLLITDYSSCAIDFMLTGKPAISFAYDYDHYANTERGLFYDLEHVFPGPVCRDFPEFQRALEAAFISISEVKDNLHELKKKVFFDHVDDANAWRVVRRVLATYVADGLSECAGQTT